MDDDEIKLFERNYNNLFKIKSIDDLSMFKQNVMDFSKTVSSFS
jgi:hypothetical protein